MKFVFPNGFLWGAATSAHQIEGGNRNDWSEWEVESAKRKVKSAKENPPAGGWPEHIMRGYPNPLQEENYISGRASDHYHRFREDFDIAKQLDHNAHRFSLEWSRIEPEEGRFNEKEIEHYRGVIKALRERGMEPFVTLWHWTLPLWVRNQGGWENIKTITSFLRYVQRIVPTFTEDVRFWMPINEPTTYIGHSYVNGVFPPHVRSLRRANRVFENLYAGMRGAYDEIHQIAPDASVGAVHYLVYHEPYRGRLRNRLVTPFLDWIRNWRFIERIAAASDFLGIDYYHHDAVNIRFGRGRWGPIETKNKNEWVNDVGWEIYPEGIYHLLCRAAGYGKPIYVTENGLADARDQYRVRFIREHLAAIARAMREGADVRGYFHWSLLDNFEWDKGFWPRFGLVEVDYKTLERKIRPSALEYKKISKENAIEW